MINADNSTGALDAKIDHVTQIVWVLVIALFLGFASTFISASAFLWQAWTTKQATYQNLVDQITAQNEDIKILIQLQQNSNLWSKENQTAKTDSSTFSPVPLNLSQQKAK